MDVLTLQGLDTTEEARLRSKIAADGGMALFPVHLYFWGTSDAKARHDFTRTREAQSEIYGDDYSTTVEQEAAHYVKYLQRMTDFVRAAKLRVGFVVESEYDVNSTVSRLTDLNGNVEWIVIASEPGSSSNLVGLDWPTATAILQSLGVTGGTVFGCNNHFWNACVPAAARHLREGGIDSTVDDSASFAVLSSSKS